jgi:Sec7-like guanine-nucleotide exchange factor
MSKSVTLKYPTVISKKYLNQYQQYKNYTQALIVPLVGCIYQGKTTSDLTVMGILMEYGVVKSTIKDKRGKISTVLSNTLKSIQ